MSHISYDKIALRGNNPFLQFQLQIFQNCNVMAQFGNRICIQKTTGND